MALPLSHFLHVPPVDINDPASVARFLQSVGVVCSQISLAMMYYPGDEKTVSDNAHAVNALGMAATDGYLQLRQVATDAGRGQSPSALRFR